MTRDEMARISLPVDEFVREVAREAAREVLETSGVQREINTLKIRLGICFGFAIGAGLFSGAGLLTRIAL